MPDEDRMGKYGLKQREKERENDFCFVMIMNLFKYP